MLPKSHRLSVRQFNLVMQNGRAHHSPLFVLRAVKIEGPSRVSATVPNKVEKKATGRNKIRRKIYDGIQSLLSVMAPNNHIILFAKTGAKDAEKDKITKEIKEIFVKAGLLR